MVFNVPGKPQGKPRPRFSSRGKYVHAFTPKSSLDYEKKIRDAYIEAGGGKIDGGVAISISAYFEIPKSYTKKRVEAIKNYEELALKKPDIDNICKSVLDALNGVAYDDDSQVFSLIATKEYAIDGQFGLVIEVI